jgi:hypothetical protein
VLIFWVTSSIKGNPASSKRASKLLVLLLFLLGSPLSASRKLVVYYSVCFNIFKSLAYISMLAISTFRKFPFLRPPSSHTVLHDPRKNSLLLPVSLAVFPLLVLCYFSTIRTVLAECHPAFSALHQLSIHISAAVHCILACFLHLFLIILLLNRCCRGC